MANVILLYSKPTKNKVSCIVYLVSWLPIQRCIFTVKCNSCRIAIQWFHVNQYYVIPYTKNQPYTSRVQGLGFFFERYAIWVPRLIRHHVTWCNLVIWPFLRE